MLFNSYVNRTMPDERHAERNTLWRREKSSSSDMFSKMIARAGHDAALGGDQAQSPNTTAHPFMGYVNEDGFPCRPWCTTRLGRPPSIPGALRTCRPHSPFVCCSRTVRSWRQHGITSVASIRGSMREPVLIGTDYQPSFRIARGAYNNGDAPLSVFSVRRSPRQANQYHDSTVPAVWKRWSGRCG